jgi:hypothetical protein
MIPLYVNNKSNTRHAIGFKHLLIVDFGKILKSYFDRGKAVFLKVSKYTLLSRSEFLKCARLFAWLYNFIRGKKVPPPTGIGGVISINIPDELIFFFAMDHALAR